MQITAALVKELRERTGAGMMECKRALVESNGDIDAAIDAMRKSGLAKAAKKAGRVAAEGVVVIAEDPNGQNVAMVEVNCETDFVTKADDFKAFTQAVVARTLAEQPADLEALLALPLEVGGDENIQQRCQELVAKIGEKITVRRLHVARGAGSLGVYRHGARIGVVVQLDGDAPELARDIAMHVAASSPICVAVEDVPKQVLAKEREIHVAQAEQSGKPVAIIEKMVAGRMKKYLNEVTLLGQPFIKDPDTPVGKLVSQAEVAVTGFVRFEVGEGIEKKVENFADEVRAQTEGK